MLLVVCPNLAVDRILAVDNFRASEVQRARDVVLQPGGKGSNVARVFRQLGGEVVLTGFVGRANGNHVVEPLRNLGIHVDAVEAYSGDCRTATIICDPASTAHPTVVNEESGVIEAGAVERLLSVIDKWLPDAKAVLVTGSLSRGVDSTFYRDVVARAKGRVKFTAVDAAGNPLRHALSAGPSFVKPNVFELSEMLDRSDLRFDEVLECMHRKVPPAFTAADQFAVTFGEEGALLMHAEGVLYARPPCIMRTNPIGAGDAFAAGYIKAHLDGLDPSGALRLATAAAISDASTVRPGFVDPAEVEKWRLLVKEEEIR